MVAPQPDLRNIFKFTILCDLLRIDMAMIVDDRQLFCYLVIQPFCSLRGEQKILIHKRFHAIPP